MVVVAVQFFNFSESPHDKRLSRNSLVVQWLGLCASTAGGTGSLPGWGTKILHAAQCGENKKQANKKARKEKRLSM